MTAKLSPLRASLARQPIRPTGIDWTNPLARGLQTLFDGASCRDLVSHRPLSPRIPAAGRYGIAHQVNSASTVAQLANHRFIAGSGMTIFALLEHGAPTGTNVGITGRGVGASNTATLLGINSSNNLIIYDGAESAPLGVQQSAGVHSYAATNLGSSLIGYTDGVLSGTVGGFSVIIDSAPLSLQVGAGASDETGAYLSGKYLLVGWWNRALTASEIMALHANPWQIFAPEMIPFFTPVVTAQYARPTSDISSGTWTASSGSDLYAMLDESAPDDGDYIVTTGASTCEVALGTLSDPGSSAGHVVRYRISSASGGITVRLRQGTTTIATWTHASAPSSLTTYEQTLTGGEADSITDYSALRLQFEAT